MVPGRRTGCGHGFIRLDELENDLQLPVRFREFGYVGTLQLKPPDMLGEYSRDGEPHVLDEV